MDPLGLRTLRRISSGRLLPLTPNLRRWYGPFRMASGSTAPHVVANFAMTLDGVVALHPQGRSSGGDITGFDPRDRMVMGLLRATADAIVVGAGTFRAVPRHVWSAEHVAPRLAEEFRSYRVALGKPPTPLNVIVSGSGRLDLSLPIFRTREVAVLVVTTTVGAGRLRDQGIPPGTTVAIAADTRGRPSARSVLAAIQRVHPSSRVLVEGGPHLFGEFLGENLLDEMFLTLVPQMAGRDSEHPRLSLVEGIALAPDRPKWGTIVDVREGGGLLFLRLSIPRAPRRGRGRPLGAA